MLVYPSIPLWEKFMLDQKLNTYEQCLQSRRKAGHSSFMKHSFRALS